jgi:hypothetical protein
VARNVIKRSSNQITAQPRPNYRSYYTKNTTLDLYVPQLREIIGVPPHTNVYDTPMDGAQTAIQQDQDLRLFPAIPYNFEMGTNHNDLLDVPKESLHYPDERAVYANPLRAPYSLGNAISPPSILSLGQTAPTSSTYNYAGYNPQQMLPPSTHFPGKRGYYGDEDDSDASSEEVLQGRGLHDSTPGVL